jgi:hypothetical protein
VVDFQEPIQAFSKAISLDELPTIDIDMVVGVMFETFRQENIPQAIQNTVINLLSGDWLVENPAWVSAEEETKMRNYLYQAINQLAWDMYRLLEEAGLFYDACAQYAYKRMLNDHTLIFTRLTC